MRKTAVIKKWDLERLQDLLFDLDLYDKHCWNEKHHYYRVTITLWDDEKFKTLQDQFLEFYWYDIFDNRYEKINLKIKKNDN